jgi:DNA invertase Pin-like site-specific DNA recombinase
MPTTELLQSHHRHRKAVISIRHSTGHQVLTNTERHQLPHAMRDHAHRRGWPAEPIEVVEADLGRSAQSPAGRDGYKALRAEVALGQVGLGRRDESTRRSRTGTDGYPWRDRCADNQGRMADRDGVYDPSPPNGRLLLGMQGIVSEVELQTLRGRLLAGVPPQAQRGDLALARPVGLLRQEDGRVVKDPDLTGPHPLPPVVQTCLARQSVSQGVRVLREQGLRLPRRHRNGETRWRPPTVAAVLAIVRQPAYPGTVVYGTTRTPPPPGRARPPPRRLAPAAWTGMVPNRYPASMTWETFARLQAILEANDAA